MFSNNYPKDGESFCSGCRSIYKNNSLHIIKIKSEDYKFCFECHAWMETMIEGLNEDDFDFSYENGMILKIRSDVQEVTYWKPENTFEEI